MSLAITLAVRGLDGIEAALGRLSPLDGPTLLSGIARLLQQQTRRRIEDDKTGPDGKAWQPNWSGTSILYRTGALSRSIDYAVTGDQIVLGSGLIYATPHQFGAVIRPVKAKALVFQVGNGLRALKKVTLPPRPFVGVSAGDASEIVEATADFLRRLLR